MDIELKAREIIAKQLGVKMDVIKMDAYFTDDLGADSLDTVELIMAFEDTFGVEIPEDEAEKLAKVRDVIDYLKTKIKA
jgi:acyl carrier protein